MKCSLLSLLLASATITGVSLPDRLDAAGRGSEQIICWNVKGVPDVDIECDFVDDLKVECKNYDPQSKSDLCKKVTSAAFVPSIGRFLNPNPSYSAPVNSQEFFSEGQDRSDRGRPSRR